MNTESIDITAVSMLKQIGSRLNKENYYGGILDLFVEQSKDIVPDMLIAIDCEDASEVRYLSHKICGSAESVGAISLARYCRAIQDLSEAEGFDLRLARKLHTRLKKSYEDSLILLFAEA
jgi:HPt (histidine-containing phosphotransfer) domain-containing protein